MMNSPTVNTHVNELNNDIMVNDYDSVEESICDINKLALCGSA